MSLPTAPPDYGPAGSAAAWRAMEAPIRSGEHGWRVYAVQTVLQHDTSLVPDGVFGPGTLAAVQTWQTKRGLDRDGIVGPVTQGKMLRSSEAAVHAAYPTLPLGLLWGFVTYEGAGILAATNPYTPTGGQPGVDCGPVQWRQYGPPFTVSGLKAAFDPRRALAYAAGALIARVKDYRLRRPTLTAGRALELAVLAHNAPFLAEQVVRYGALLHPDSPALWTFKPDGGHYTQAEWSIIYPQRIMSFVK